MTTTYLQSGAAIRRSTSMFVRLIPLPLSRSVCLHALGASKTAPDSDMNARLRMETWRVLEDFQRLVAPASGPQSI